MRASLTDDPLAFLRASLPQAPPGRGRDMCVAQPGEDAPVAAAVLVPVIARAPAPTILFTRRTRQLSRHGGQVSFPGGRCEADDLSPVETALRETMEETGIDPAFVSVAGFLSPARTATGFDIQPVVGLVAEGFALAPNSGEVAEIFEAPLAFFLDPGNARTGSRELAGRMRRFHVFEPAGHVIWGVTAALLVNLAGRLAPDTYRAALL